MKTLFRWIFLYLPAALVGLVGVIALTIWLGKLASMQDMRDLRDIFVNEGLGSAISTVRTHLFGVDEALITDPSYGRIEVSGKGRHPWVMRGNLDGRVRTL